MSERTPQERQADALEQIAVRLAGITEALGDIRSKLTALTTAVRRRSQS